MSAFAAAEIAYLMSQPLGWLATLGKSGELHVVPARFRYDPDHDSLDVTGRLMGRSKKFRDVQEDERASFVVDDAAGPSRPRGVEVRGRAEAVRGGDRITPGADPEFIRLRPARIVSWGIDTDATHPHSRRVRP